METTTTFIRWAAVVLTNHVSAQERLHAEIDSVIGRQRQPTLDDRTKSVLIITFNFKTCGRSSLSCHQRRVESSLTLVRQIPSPLLPFPSPFPYPSFPSLYPSLPLEVGPLYPAKGVEERCKFPQWDLGRSPSGNRIWCIFGIFALKSDIWWHHIY